MIPHPRTAVLLMALLAGLPACASWYERQADEDAGELLEEATRRLDAERAENLVRPGPDPVPGLSKPLPTMVLNRLPWLFFLVRR